MISPIPADFDVASLWTAGRLYNDFSAEKPLTGWEILAGPFGLLAFVPFVPLLRFFALRWPRGSIIVTSLAWLVLTLNPLAALEFLGCVALGAAWLLLLAAFRRRGALSRRGMIALVWIGLHALAYPLWIWPHLLSYGWEPGRLAALHALGIAYFVFRYIAWGVALADAPDSPLRPAETIAWILYPPIMRLGPVMRRDEFLQRFDAWQPAGRVDWREVGRRGGWFLLGAVALGVVVNNSPHVPAGKPDFYAAPELYRTSDLIRMIYLFPLRIYLILWMYNELAAIVSTAIGIRTDNNFDHLPRATSIRDFWRRWHITVGNWLRTYLFIPLGGSRSNVYLNYLIVFVYCGIWHGAAWSFVAWGASQGLGLAVQRGWDNLKIRFGWARATPSRAWVAVCWLLTMHYQFLTIFMFTDFEYCGVRVARELSWRWLGD